MYHFPKDFDPVKLTGNVLEMICFAENALYLHFNNKLLITVEGNYKYVDAQSCCDESQAFPIKNSSLPALIGCQILDAMVEAGETLILRFSNEESLIIYGENGPYESYHVKFGKREFTI